MKKTVVREQVVKVEDHVFACDLCEKIVEEGSPCIAVKAGIVKKSGSITLENSPLMVCSDCFAGAKLVLDTKRIPDLRNALEKANDDYDELFSKKEEYQKYVQLTKKKYVQLTKNGSNL